MIAFHQLEQLTAIFRCGTLSQAAEELEELHLSQPALSRSMQKLESELQVSLFTRQKNKLAFNENGRLAVRYAEEILERLQSMTVQLRQFDRSRRTIFIGSCAPAPLWEITPVLSEVFPELAISGELQENEVLLQGLREGAYQMIVLPYPVERDGLCCVRYGEEHLLFSLPPAHPLSGSKALHLRDLNGETMLLRSNLGFWEKLGGEKMPDTRFLVQEDAAFDALVRASALPCFASDLVAKREGDMPDRVMVPILDPEANVTFYCLCQGKERQRFERFFARLRDPA